MTGSLAPPPPYGSEQGSILLEAGREGAQSSHGHYPGPRHGRTRSGNFRHAPPSPGPVRSPTDISLAHLSHIPSHEYGADEAGEPSSAAAGQTGSNQQVAGSGLEGYHQQPPPEYSSPRGSDAGSPRGSSEGERAPLISTRRSTTSGIPPIPSYSDAVAEDRARERQRSGSAVEQRRSRS